eukprot:6471170-Amphidinium_carterae.1
MLTWGEQVPENTALLPLHIVELLLVSPCFDKKGYENVIEVLMRLVPSMGFGNSLHQRDTSYDRSTEPLSCKLLSVYLLGREQAG